MCAELDVVDVKVDKEEGWYVILRLTWAQHKAYLQGRFTPRYVPGRSDDVGLDADGNTFETIDVTDQGF
jgi:hypothetical protein